MMTAISKARMPAPGAAPAWGAVYAMALCVAVLIASEFMPVSLLSPIARDLGLTEGRAGQAISISGVFAVGTSLFITVLAGTRDRRHVLIALTGLLVVSGVSLIVRHPQDGARGKSASLGGEKEVLGHGIKTQR